MKAIQSLAALLIGLGTPHLVAQTSTSGALLEDFSNIRMTNYAPLWSAYLGEDPIQITSLAPQMLRDSIGPAPNGYYIHFFPNTGGGYPYPAGFAQYWIKKGTWDPNSNRLVFKMKCAADIQKTQTGYGNVQFGTYVKPHNYSDPSYQGQHYYHLFDPNFYANRWVMFVVNRVPQHRVGMLSTLNWPEDPEVASPSLGSPVHYFDGLTRFYIDSQSGAWSNNTCHISDFEFSTVTGEPDSMVSSVTATYSGTGYEVAFSAPKGPQIIYHLRYSTSSMKQTGFASGIDGGTLPSTGNSYTSILWKSPPMAEAPMMYVAIQPPGQTSFTEVAIPMMRDPVAAVPVASCDVNGDSKTDLKDVQLAVSAALNQTNCTADLDGNGKCDVVDVQRIVNAMNGQTCRLGP